MTVKIRHIKERSKLTWSLVSVVLLTLCPCHAHPQCVDGSPPRPVNLKLCSHYSALTCCDRRVEGVLQQQFYLARHRLQTRDWQRCREDLKKLLCERCTPVAAHVLQQYGDGGERVLPGLCAAYCSAFYRRCRDVVWFIDPQLAADASFQTERDFCNRAAISDSTYCYPDYTTSDMMLDSMEMDDESAEVTTLQGAGRTAQAADRSKAPQVSGVTGSGSGCLCLQRIVSGLANPLLGKHAGDGSGRLFVGEQRGLVYIVDLATGQLLSEPFVNITSKLLIQNYFGDERGLNGMAFHPHFATNGRLFVYYNAPLSREGAARVDPALGRRMDHVSRLSELRVLTSYPQRVDPDWEKVLLEVLQPYANHNGGEMFFRDDGYLYLFLGDGGSAGDPHNLAQNTASLLGKVLRLDVDTPSDNPGRNYSIPPDNPYVTAPAPVRPEIYAIGVRNIWRCGVDAGDPLTGWGRGRVVCGDVGQSLYEELDLLKKGANYGWSAKEGYECYKNRICGRIGVEELPVYAYNHTVGQSVTGGQFYRGCRSPTLNGLYIYGDYMSRRLFILKGGQSGQWENRDLTLCADAVCRGPLTNIVDKYILSFGQDQQGEVYMLTSNSSRSDVEDGSVYLIVDPFSTKTVTNCPVSSGRSRS